MKKLEKVTIETMRRLKGLDRYYAMTERMKWLEKQRNQDKKEVKSTNSKIRYMKNKRRHHTTSNSL